MASRLLRSARGTARLVGVEYNGKYGVEEVWSAMGEHPKVVLMESFNCPNSDPPRSGGVVPYHSEFSKKALHVGSVLVPHQSAREHWSGEVVAVLAAVRSGAEVRFCDRAIDVSFNRLVHRLRPQDLSYTIAKALQIVYNNSNEGSTLSPQNGLCPAFPELFDERHCVMAHFIQRAADEHGHVVAVLGKEHLPGVEGRWGDSTDIDALLEDPHLPLSEQLEQRAALAALLVTSMAFPPNIVLDMDDPELTEEQVASIRVHYTRYRNLCTTRMQQLIPSSRPEERSRDQMIAQLQRRGEGVIGLFRLADLIAEFEEIKL